MVGYKPPSGVLCGSGKWAASNLSGTQTAFLSISIRMGNVIFYLFLVSSGWGTGQAMKGRGHPGPLPPHGGTHLSGSFRLFLPYVTSVCASSTAHGGYPAGSMQGWSSQGQFTVTKETIPQGSRAEMRWAETTPMRPSD